MLLCLITNIVTPTKADVADLSSLANLREDVLVEVVREAEMMVAAQFQSHLSSDQRAFGIAGLALTAATAAFAASYGLPRVSEPDLSLRMITFGFALGLLLSAGYALISAVPKKFCFPGNEPKNWLPEYWNKLHHKKNMQNTRMEQAVVLQSQIGKNRKMARSKALLQIDSLIVAFLTILICGVSLKFI